jgi:chromosomal replication initiator protein
MCRAVLGDRTVQLDLRRRRDPVPTEEELVRSGEKEGADAAWLEEADAADLEGCWARVRGRLRGEVGEAAYRSWLKPLVLVGLHQERLRLAIPTRFMRDWVVSNYSERIQELWLDESGNALNVQVVVQPPAAAAGRLDDDADSAGAHKPGDPRRVSAGTQAARRAKTMASQAGAKSGPGLLGGADGDFDQGLSGLLDERLTFENFVVGGPNELAHATAKRVAEASSVPFNPLFIYGPVGLGKTHLMNAIAWEIRARKPEKKVIYLSAEKFMYHFVRAIRTKNTVAFKELFRSVDVLMIDDIQFIGGREATQEEFFHTFNALVDQNRQVVISADKSPSDLEGVEERMRSRLGWGMVADIHPTTYELRLGILQARCEGCGVDVPPKVLEFLAHKIVSNVRELEGALTRIVAHATLVGRPVTLETTADLLHDLLRANDRKLTVEEIQKKVAAHFNMRLVDMQSARRARSVARPRQIAMYLSKQMTSRSLPEIGRKFGGRDHTTVMHAVRKVEELKATDSAFAEDLELLRRMLEA